MENLDVKNPLALNSMPAPMIEVPAALVTPMAGNSALQPVVLVPLEAVASVLVNAPQKASSAKYFKLGASICLDGVDLACGWIPGLGQMIDITCAVICAAMWGKKGWWALLDLVDVTGVVGAFIPTCTIIALSCWDDD